MQLHSMVVDGFFDDFEKVRAWADSATYGDIVNPVDGVTYPGICAEIPRDIREETQIKVVNLLHGLVNIRTMFTRISYAGVQVPHQAHNDASMGMFSLMVYLNRPEDCEGGTELLQHVSAGMEYGPGGGVGEIIWQRETNKPAQWERLSICPMKPNRAFLFDARLMHRAAPIGGFGSNPQDGRLVLTAFFDA